MGRGRLDTNTILFPSLCYVSSPLGEKGHRHTVTVYSRGPVPERIRPEAVRDSTVRLQQDETCVGFIQRQRRAVIDTASDNINVEQILSRLSGLRPQASPASRLFLFSIGNSTFILGPVMRCVTRLSDKLIGFSPSPRSLDQETPIYRRFGRHR